MTAGSFQGVRVTRAGVVGPIRGADLAGHGVSPADYARAFFVLRPMDVLHRAVKQKQFDGLPLLRTHVPTLGHDARRWQQHIVGSTGTAKLDEPFIVNRINIWDRALAAELERGVGPRQFSVGFVSQLERAPGDDHDFIMRDCRVDHLTITDRALLGEDCSLPMRRDDGDDWQAPGDALAIAFAAA